MAKKTATLHKKILHDTTSYITDHYSSFLRHSCKGESRLIASGATGHKVLKAALLLWHALTESCDKTICNFCQLVMSHVCFFRQITLKASERLVARGSIGLQIGSSKTHHVLELEFLEAQFPRGTQPNPSQPTKKDTKPDHTGPHTR